MPKKTKAQYSAETMPEKDRCQSPAYAIEPLLPYLTPFDTIWECAVGTGYLEAALMKAFPNKRVIASDINFGSHGDFFGDSWLEPEDNGVIVTNPPFSLKFKWLARCYDLGHPFALLMPADTLFAATANKLFQKHGVEIIIMNPRIDFHMPNLGWSGNGAQMATAWFTWGLEIGQMISFVDISEAKKKFRETL